MNGNVISYRLKHQYFILKVLEILHSLEIRSIYGI